ncbi:MAG: choice-of-anchor D domain-containing protein, partial [bacterium]
RGVSPEIDVDPTAHDWGAVAVGTSVSRPFVVRNGGSATLDVASAALSGPQALAWSLPSGGADFALAPGESTTVDVVFAPATVGPHAAALSFASDDLDEPMLAVALAGQGVTPDIAAAPAALDWGDLRLAETATLSVTVTNAGTSLLSVGGSSLAGAHAADFAIVAGAGPFALPPGGSAAVRVRFQPSALGARSAVLHLASDDLDENPLDVLLAGRGVEPDVAVDPSSADFGAALLGAGPVVRAFTVRNLGTHELAGGAPVVVGPNAADFEFASGAGAFVLAPSASRVVEIAFTPSSLGPKSATLRVPSDDPDEPVVDVPLVGAGVEPDIDATPFAHDWGAVRIARAAAATFVAHNLGTSDLHVAASLVGPQAADWTIVTGAGAATVAPGGFRAVNVSFSPLGLGPREGSLRLTSDDPDEAVVDVALAGEGLPATAPEITLAPASHDWGAVFPGASVTADLAIVNDGDDALAVSAVGLGGANAGEFAIDSGGGSFVLAPGASRALVVRFHPVALGTKSAEIMVASNDDDEPVVTLVLAGLCVAAPAGGDVVFVETLGAGATSSAVVTVPAAGGSGASLYLAAVATKPLRSVV